MSKSLYGVALEFRASGAKGCRSLFHWLGSHTHLGDASPAPHSQHGGGDLVPLSVHVPEGVNCISN